MYYFTYEEAKERCDQLGYSYDVIRYRPLLARYPGQADKARWFVLT